MKFSLSLYKSETIKKYKMEKEWNDNVLYMVTCFYIFQICLTHYNGVCIMLRVGVIYEIAFVV